MEKKMDFDKIERRAASRKRAFKAADYVLLHRAEMVDDVDKRFFPYEDYQVNISFEEVLDEQIDEDFRSIEGQLPLDLCVIELVNLKSTGKETVGTLEIERIVYEDEGLEPE